GGLVELDAHAPVGRDAVRTPAYRGAPRRNVPHKVRDVVVRLPIFNLRFGGHQSPGKADVHGQIAGQAPVILNKRPHQLEAAADRTAKEGLIVGRENSHRTQQQIGDVVAARGAKVYDIPVLKRVVSYIHLLGAKHTADPDIVFAADEVDGVANRVDVRPALIR